MEYCCDDVLGLILGFCPVQAIVRAQKSCKRLNYYVKTHIRALIRARYRASQERALILWAISLGEEDFFKEVAGAYWPEFVFYYLCWSGKIIYDSYNFGYLLTLVSVDDVIMGTEVMVRGKHNYLINYIFSYDHSWTKKEAEEVYYSIIYNGYKYSNLFPVQFQEIMVNLTPERQIECFNLLCEGKYKHLALQLFPNLINFDNSVSCIEAIRADERGLALKFLKRGIKHRHFIILHDACVRGYTEIILELMIRDSEYGYMETSCCEAHKYLKNIANKVIWARKYNFGKVANWAAKMVIWARNKTAGPN